MRDPPQLPALRAIFASVQREAAFLTLFYTARYAPGVKTFFKFQTRRCSMNPTTTQPTTGITFVVHFWREWTGEEVALRGRVEHVESGWQASFLEIGGLLRFFERFGIGGEGPPAGKSEDSGMPEIGEPSLIEPS